MPRITRIASAILVALVAAASAEWVAVGPDGGNIQALAADPQQPATLYALPYEYPDLPRVFRTTDAGTSWSAVGRMNDNYPVSIAVDPHQANILYATGRTSVAYRSTDAGATWSSVILLGTAYYVETDPVVPGRVYMPGYFSSGNTRQALFVSTDYGATWQVRSPDTATGTANSCAADPHNAGTVYLGCSYSRLYKSTDAGLTWTLANSGLAPDLSITAIDVNPADSRIVIIAAGTSLYRSLDAGVSWQPAGTFARVTDVCFSPAAPGTAYALGYTDSMRFFASSDTGATWTTPPSGLVLNKGAKLLADPDVGAAAYLATPTGILKTADRGSHWTTAHGGMRLAKVPALAVPPWDPRSVYLEAAENGVFTSSCGGDTWTRCADFLSCGAICGIGVAPASPDILWALEGSG